MLITITIATDNAAFEYHGVENQVTWILRDLARRLGDGLTNAPIKGLKVLDSNGNVVGAVRVVETQPTCPTCGSGLSYSTSTTKGTPTYCDVCDREVAAREGR